VEFIFNLLQPLMWAEAWVMWAWHGVGTAIGLSSGWSWALGIIGLTAVVRLLLVPLFVKQIQASRKMQLIQPELQKIQAKYKGKKDPESRQAMTQETMEFYKKTGTNPFSSCMPILLQMPFFFALFQLLNNLKGISEGRVAKFPDGIGPLTKEVAIQFEASTLFGSKLSDSFVFGTSASTKILTAILIVLMSVTTFTTQHQLMRKNMPQAALDSPYARQQKIIIYVMPFFFAFSGINFPIGVLLYWLTTNLWTMFQQFYVIRRMPAPGSAAERALQERLRKRGKEVTPMTIKGLEDSAAGEGDAPTSRQRQQPIGKKRAKAQGVPKDSVNPAPGMNPGADPAPPVTDAAAAVGAAGGDAAKPVSGAAASSGQSGATNKQGAPNTARPGNRPKQPNRPGQSSRPGKPKRKRR